MLCCLNVQLQGLWIGVTTKGPDSGPLPQSFSDIKSSDQYWFVGVVIRTSNCRALHNGQKRVLQWDLDDSAGNTFGVAVSEKGELHLYHNGRDVGVAWEGLPTDKPLWGFVELGGDLKVETNYMIAKGEVVTCGEVVCGVMFVSLPFVHVIVTCTLHFTWLLCESERYCFIQLGLSLLCSRFKDNAMLHCS